MPSLIRLIAFALMAIFPSLSFANQCDIKDTVSIGFFNGVGNDFSQATKSLKSSEFLIRSNSKARYSTSVLYYNETDSVGLDAIETMSQKLNEELPGLGERFEIYSQIMAGQGDIVDRLSARSNLFLTIRNDYIKYHSKLIFDALNKLTLREGTLKMYDVHRKLLDAEMKAKRKLLLVAHSQGNLFVNRAYDYVKSKLGEHGVSVIHVAPASSKMNGPWILADNDIVINNLLRGVGFVPKATDSIGPYIGRPPGINNLTDISGHGFQEIYLNPHLTTSKRFVSLSQSSIKRFAGVRCDDFAPQPITVKRPSNYFAQCDPRACIDNLSAFLSSTSEDQKIRLFDILNSVNNQCKDALRAQKLSTHRNLSAKWNRKSGRLEIECKSLFAKPVVTFEHPYTVR